jgi:hypothetical protein
LGLEPGYSLEPIGDLVVGQRIVGCKFQRALGGSVRLRQRIESLRKSIASQRIFPSLQVGLALSQVKIGMVGKLVHASFAHGHVTVLNSLGFDQFVPKSMMGANPGDESDEVFLKDQREDRIATGDVCESVL